MPAPPSHVFKKIYGLGQRLCEAVDQQRLESATALVQERSLLIQRLEAFDPPSEIDAEWERWRSKFAAQHEALKGALATLDEQTTETRRQVEDLSQAHKKYGASHASPSGVLHPNFSA